MFDLFLAGLIKIMMSSMERALVESRKILKSIKIKPTKASMISPVDLLSAMKALARKEEENTKEPKEQPVKDKIVKAE